MNTQTKPGVACRWMIRVDMGEVLRIEREAFPCPWSESDFTAVLRRNNCIGHVAVHQDRVVGYMIYELRRNSLHLLNFAVDVWSQRQGVGAAMAARLRAKLSSQRRKCIVAHVRESNLDACLFFKAMGFVAVDVCRDHYEDSPEDAYRFEYRLPKE